MSRPISESLSLLSETLGNCKTNLKEKEVADVDNIKISDVDEKIMEIQAGSGGGSGSTPFTYIDYIEYNEHQYKDNFSGVTYTGYDTSYAFNIIFKVKLKKMAYFINMPSNLTVEPSAGNNEFKANTEYTCTITDRNLSFMRGLPFVFSMPGEYEETYEQPDFFFVRYNYEGE